MIFKAIFAQVRAPRAKMAEKCEKVLFTVKVIDIVIFKVIFKVKIIFKVFVKVFVKVMKKIVGLDPQILSPTLLEAMAFFLHYYYQY